MSNADMKSAPGGTGSQAFLRGKMAISLSHLRKKNAERILQRTSQVIPQTLSYELLTLAGNFPAGHAFLERGLSSGETRRRVTTTTKRRHEIE
jgi:hypothetical protein